MRLEFWSPSKGELFLNWFYDRVYIDFIYFETDSFFFLIFCSLFNHFSSLNYIIISRYAYDVLTH